MRGHCRSTHECHRPPGLEGGAQVLSDHRQFADDGVLQGVVVHFGDVVALALGRLQGGGVNDLDRVGVGPVAAGHLRIHLAHGAVDVHVTVLLVHVVRVGAALVAQPNAVVLHLGRALVEELVNGEQLTPALLGLVQLLHEVPEPGLGQDLVLREQAHPVDLRDGVLRCGGRPADDLVLVHPRLARRVHQELPHVRLTNALPEVGGGRHPGQARDSRAEVA
mmetsp:Transcript_120564/g.346377  ORF Transcript_120564/g.346377 Transcript_120564/m.346377 type:complete len:221 (-) Transcript_120564:7-669(-)